MQVVRARLPTSCVHRAKAAREAGASALQVVPIFAALPPEQQARVFEPAPDGARKVLLNRPAQKHTALLHYTLAKACRATRLVISTPTCWQSSSKCS